MNSLFPVKNVFCLLVGFMVFSLSAYSQGDPAAGEYLEQFRQDSVSISYKWKQYGLFKKNKPYQLVLKIENRNPHRISLGFSVSYYWGAVRQMSSDRMEYCIKPKRSIRGMLWDLVFESGGYTILQLKDPKFSIDLTEVRIEHEPDCRTQLNLKLKSGSRELK